MPSDQISSLLPERIAIAVTFHFVEKRLQYLDKISSHFRELGQEVDVWIVTNVDEPGKLDQIRAVLDGKNFKYEFFIPYGLGHPYLLTWSHFAVFRKLIDDPSYSHYMYLEDDILLQRHNVEYWMEGREKLRNSEFYPSFMRVEKMDGDDRWYSTDCVERSVLNKLPRVSLKAGGHFFGLPWPYQGMYLLDREQTQKHLNGRSSVLQYLRWGLRETATQGLIHEPVRKGFISRNLFPYDLAAGKIDERCFIHHLPNNYANRTEKRDKLGVFPVEDLLIGPWQ